ncbi:MAG: hypothetical protein AAF941_02615 [Pseudomonadota bacterium]
MIFCVGAWFDVTDSSRIRASSGLGIKSSGFIAMRQALDHHMRVNINARLKLTGGINAFGR